MRVKNHLRSNVIGYVALFVAMSGTAYAANTVGSSDIINGAVQSIDLANDDVRSIDIQDETVASVDILNEEVTDVDVKNNSLRTNEIRNETLESIDVLDETLGQTDLGTDSVASSEIATDSVGSSEIQTGVVGADELDTVHEHFGTATDIIDGTAHDGAYAAGTATVACGLGEDLLSVSVDWTNTGGHNELVTSGVDVIDRSTDPETAVVRVAYDGGASTATFQPVATCIF